MKKHENPIWLRILGSLDKKYQFSREIGKIAGDASGYLENVLSAYDSLTGKKVVKEDQTAEKWEKILVILDSFKIWQVSEKLDLVSKSIIKTLRCEDIKPELYNLNPDFIRFYPENIRFNPEITKFFDDYKEEGEPFDEERFKLEPDNISQLKKLMNALYYARLVFIDLEKIDTKRQTRGEAVMKLYDQTVLNGHKAAILLTHVDVDLKGIFTEELSAILPVLKKVQDLSGNYAKEQAEITEAITNYPELSHKVGTIAGKTVRRLDPEGVHLDYDFLTKGIPGAIQQANALIQQHTTQLDTGLDQKTIDEYNKVALSLLNNLEDLRSDDLFVPLKLLNYIHIINHVIRLSNDILNQVRTLNGSSQEAIRAKLRELKYDVLPTLFGLVDKIEDNSMLKPGTLSLPLMRSIEPLYKFIVNYADKVANLNDQNEVLLTIEDPKFLTRRLDHSYKRIDEANKHIFKINKAEEALNAFYAIIDGLENKELPIHKLSTEIKNKLVEHYKIIKPYVVQVGIDGIDLNTALTDSFLDTNIAASMVDTALKYLLNEIEPDSIARVLKIKDGVRQLIEKDRVSKKFHIGLNETLITSVQEHSNLALFPYNEPTSIFNVDESTALSTTKENQVTLEFEDNENNKVLTNPEDLNSEQALELYQWYRNKQNKLITARNAYIQFMEITQGRPLQLKYADKVKARNLYNVFQPYFVDGAPLENKDAVINCDKYLSQMFAIKKITATPPDRELFNKLDEHFQDYCTTMHLAWQKKGNQYLQLAKEKYDSEHRAIQLEPDVDENGRSHYLLKNTDASKAVKEFRTSLFNLTNQLNKAMQEDLKIENHDVLPFPEVENKNLVLEEGKQVLALKHIFNSLYHIEIIISNLEKINEQSSDVDLIQKVGNIWFNYVQHLAFSYEHIYEIIFSIQGLINDPHYNLIAREIRDKAQNMLATLQEHTYAYQVGPPQTGSNDQPIQFTALWYALSAFNVIPVHIRSLRNNNYISADELSELHLKAKQSTVIIETLINSSSSYFKLFLQTPNMYILYNDLRNKFNEFTNTSHDAVMSNLGLIQTTVFTPMMIEADMWEDRLGLAPGTLSGPLKQVIDEYYKGLLSSLDLDSKTHIDLVCDETLLLKRQANEKAKIKIAEEHCATKKQKYTHIENFYKFIDDNKSIIESQDEKNWTEEFKTQCTTHYKLCHPRLVKLQKKLNFQHKAKDVDINTDAFFKSTNKSYEVKLTNVLATVTAGHHYFKGLVATDELAKNAAIEKLDYLENLHKKKQEEDDPSFILDYTQKAFDKELAAVCNRHIGLQYMDKEYTRDLKAYLLTFEKETIQETVNQSATAKENNFINLNIQALLHKRASQFEADNFANFYHLDMVRIALSRFKLYLSRATADKDSLYEDEKTLNAKSLRVNLVDDIAADDTIPIDERFKQIKQKVIDDPSFKKVLCTQKKVDFLSWAYIQQCFFDLLEALHLYSASRVRLCKQITNAVDNKPQISVLKDRFGLFSAENKPKPDALPGIPALAGPQIAP